MKLASILGIGQHKIIELGCHTMAEVSEQKTLWFIKINTKAVRSGPMDGATFPGLIYFTYTVEGVDYKGCRLVSPNDRCPIKGERIRVYYSPDEPTKYAVKI